MFWFFGSIVLFIRVVQPVLSADRPNIVFIVADDLGWNDVGFHGSNQIPTPNIDALAYSGVILNQYYVAPICTPSRSAIMTGKHPIHTGMQHDVLFAAEARGLPLKEKLLPQYLKEVGYSTHAIGKWHLGFYKKEYTPLYRGFDTHFGYWTGHQDYDDHTAMEYNTWGLDMRRGMDPAWDVHGSYSTDLFTSEAVSIISNHNTSSPLFLYLAHVAVHSANPYNPLPAPDHVVAQFVNITDYSRRRFAGVLTKLDDSIGKVVHALQTKGLLNNTIIIFTTDNGGPAAGFNLNAASNWPLRGVKYTLFEGGVRGAGLLWSSKIKPDVNTEKIHITDWLPTILTAVNYTKHVKGLDGVDAWSTITKGTSSKRTKILHNLDSIDNAAALTVNDYKIIKGTSYPTWDQWYGPSGRDLDIKYDTNLVINSPAGQALRNIGKPLYEHKILRLRRKAEISCNNVKKGTPCQPTKSPCLFNIVLDPCELDNLAETLGSIVTSLEEQLNDYNATALPPSNKPSDPSANPKFWDHTWTNFGDYPSPITTTTSKPNQETYL